MQLDLPELQKHVHDSAGIRRRQVLQPLGGRGDKIFPPTYPSDDKNAPDPLHAFEKRWIDGREVTCVILDTVQSRANRMESALLEASDRGDIQLPYIEVVFTDPDLRQQIGKDGRITTLDAPHRIYDAAFRDSLLGGVPFMSSELGLRLAGSRSADATAVLETSPHALIFGGWHTQGEGGGMGAKFQRALVSEIFGVDVPHENIFDSRTGDHLATRTAGRRATSRIDPLSITKAVTIYRDLQGNWSDNEKNLGPGAKPVRPSEINHGHITPNIKCLGVTMAYATNITTLAFPALRRLRFGRDENRNQVARTYLAALALLACLEEEQGGYNLRSSCNLVPEGPAPLELIFADGKLATFDLDVAGARDLYAEALRAVLDAGFQLRLTPTQLVPQDKLVVVVRQSKDRALRGEQTELEARD